jgi:hypothetical protein
MKNLTDEQLDGISEGTYSLDHQIRDFIRTALVRYREKSNCATNY